MLTSVGCQITLVVAAPTVKNGQPTNATLPPPCLPPEELAHWIMAAADFVVVPSRFEPCGLVAQAGVRYGAVPIVCAVGGLKDLVTHDVSPAWVDMCGLHAFTFESRPRCTGLHGAVVQLQGCAFLLPAPLQLPHLAYFAGWLHAAGFQPRWHGG